MQIVVLLVAVNLPLPPILAQAKEPKTVATVSPTRSDIVRRITLPATLAADQEIELHAAVPGFVDRILVDLGSRVAVNDVVAESRQPDLLLQRPLAEARVRTAEAARAAAAARVAAARSDVDEPLRVLARLQQAKANAPDAVASMDLESAEARLAAARAQLAVAEAAVASAEAEVALQTAEVARIDGTLAMGVVRAPFAGIVRARRVDVGSAVPAGLSSGGGGIVRLLADDRVRVRCEVPEDDVRFVRAGTPVQVHVPAAGADVNLPTTIARLTGQIESSARSMLVEADLPNEDHRLVPGMFARIVLDLESRADVLSVPSSSLVEVQSKLYVLVVRDGLAKRIPVDVGADDGIRAEIRSGLSAEDVVITMGRAAAADLEPVRAMAAPAKEGK